MDQLVIAGGVNSASTSPRSMVPAWVTSGSTVDVADPPRPARRAQPRHVDHRRLERRRRRRASPAKRWTPGHSGRIRRHFAAIDEGRFKEEIVPIETPHGLFSVDEHPRRDTSLEKLASLKVLHPEIEGFGITAGNSSGGNDAAAALAVASSDLGLPALGTVRSWASVGVDPADHRSGPGRGDPEGARPRRTVDRRRRPVRDQRGIRRAVRRQHQAARPRPRQGQHERQRLLARPSRSRRPVPGCWSRSSTSCAVAAAASVSRRCVRAAVWARPPSSRCLRLEWFRHGEHRRSAHCGARRISARRRAAAESGRESPSRRGARGFRVRPPLGWSV